MGKMAQVLPRFAADATANPNVSDLLLTTAFRQGLIVGFLGNLTTLSSVGWNTIHLLLEDRPFLALADIGANFLAGLFAVWLGIMLVKLWS